MSIDPNFITEQKKQIAAAVLPAMEKLYLHDGVVPLAEFRPEFKELERIVSYYDYWQCGISVLADKAVAGDQRALVLIDKIRDNCHHYSRNIFNNPSPGRDEIWAVPLRRLLLHLALAYEKLLPVSGAEKTAWMRQLIEQQVPLAIEHNHGFFPGVENLHLTSANNHTAIFMQGIYHCGRVLGRSDWQDLAFEFAERFYSSGHQDGYWEENTNQAREGGPSGVYTRLTAGCLYDLLDGRRGEHRKFFKAGELARQFINHDRCMMPIADERTNSANMVPSYGIALHSLSPEGRAFIHKVFVATDWEAQTPETMAVAYRELELMVEGQGADPENSRDGNFRITLPLGVLRSSCFTAGISALRALNCEIRPTSDYALDHQAMVYLSHSQTGVILSGIKSKRNPDFSTLRVGEDAYPVKTGELKMGPDWAEAQLHYASFEATIRWDIGKTARLTMRVDTDRTVKTALSIEAPDSLRTAADYRFEEYQGFSPYTAANKSAAINMLVLEWQKELVLEFVGEKG
jgi:hypothetical protein